MNRNPLLEPTIFIGTAASVLLAVIVLFISAPSDPKLLSLIVGLAGIIISLCLEILFRLARGERLQSGIESVSWLSPLIADITEALQRIEATDRLQPFRDASMELLRDTTKSVQDIARGRYKAPIGEAILERRTDEAKHHIRAVSIQAMDMPRWQSGVGEKYWEANLRAISRGIRIERVFIYDDWSRVQPLITLQSKAKVDTYAIKKAGIPEDLRVDMAVWDDRFTYNFELNSEGVPIGNLYSVNDVDVSRRIRQFERLKDMARPTNGTSEPEG